ncbi:MAG: trehalose-phosphatase [Candidatus Omnitrophica bacterium]|nr:trehalose-phosphatase [Candidatus Omnitrophota bacterium]
MKHLLSAWDEIAPELTKDTVMLFLDYDGTLTPIVRHPSLARLTESNKNILKQLSRKQNIRVCIISGRSLADLKKQIGISNVIYVGNHGFELEGVGTGQIEPADQKTQKLISEIDAQLQSALKGISSIFIENKTITLSIHYRLVSKKDVALAKAQLTKVLTPYLDHSQIVLREGKKVWEVRPAVPWDKGSTVLWFLECLAFKMNCPVLPIYIGDDETDEDAFKVLKETGLGVKVSENGNESSEARYYLRSTEEVFEFLKYLVALKKEKRKSNVRC